MLSSNKRVAIGLVLFLIAYALSGTALVRSSRGVDDVPKYILTSVKTLNESYSDEKGAFVESSSVTTLRTDTEE